MVCLILLFRNFFVFSILKMIDVIYFLNDKFFLINFNVLKIGRFLGDEIEYIIEKNLIIV